MTGCINLLTEAMRLTNSMSRSFKSKEVIHHQPSSDFLKDGSTACHQMMRDFEKDGIPQACMIDLVGNYLDEVVASNNKNQV
jgi:hypothetical protein